MDNLHIVLKWTCFRWTMDEISSNLASSTSNNHHSPTHSLVQELKSYNIFGQDEDDKEKRRINTQNISLILIGRQHIHLILLMSLRWQSTTMIVDGWKKREWFLTALNGNTFNLVFFCPNLGIQFISLNFKRKMQIYAWDVKCSHQEYSEY